MSDPTPHSSSDTQASDATGRLGGMLRGARQALGLTEREAADAMNLSAHFLEALESEQFEKLPAPAFVRGYLRSYSRLLGLSEEDVLARYYELTEEDRTDPYFAAKREPRDRSSEMMHEHTGQVLAAVFALAVLVTLIALWAAWPSDDATPVPPAATSMQGPAGEVQPELPIEAIQAREAVAASPDLGFPTTEPIIPAEPGRVVTTRSGSTISVDAGGEDRLRFLYTQDCWTEIRDAEDRQIYGDLNRTGQTLELQGKAPFTILVGYAPGVTLHFNGQPVALAPHTRSNVATLVLGQ